MFERLLFKSEPDYGGLVDVGALAEALIFYGHVELICNSATLEYLSERIHAKILLDLIKSEQVTVYLLTDQLAVSSVDRANMQPLHGFVKLSSHDPTYDDSAERALRRTTSDRQVIRAIIRGLHPLGHADFGAPDAMSALMDVEVTNRLVLTAIKAMVPSAVLADFSRFTLHREGEGFVVDTNLNFEELNRAYHQSVPKAHSSITPAWLIALLQGAQENLYFAARFRSEIANGRIAQAILRENIQAVVEKARRNAAQIDAFKSMTMDGYSLREAVNDGTVPFAQVLKLLEKARRFREWLDDQPANADLVKEFHRASLSSTWVEKLPGKTLRWSVFTGLGVAVDSQIGAGSLATLAAQGLSVFDTFLLDRLVGGWKPNQFVDQHLLPLIRDLSKELGGKERN